MKVKKYKNGSKNAKSYLKPVGTGFETGFSFGGKTLFVGNFINPAEASRWWTVMNREIHRFAKKYKIGTAYPAQFFSHFIRSHLYKNYYQFLDSVLPRHGRAFAQELKKNEQKYRKIKGQWASKTQKPFLKAA